MTLRRVGYGAAMLASAHSSVGIACQEPAGRALLERLRGRVPRFVCVVAHTDTCLIPGISAAGLTPDARSFTPAADAEIVMLERARCLQGVPSSPLGPPGPAIITAAALRLVPMSRMVVDAGTRVRPQAPCLLLGEAPGRSILTGWAVPNATALFRRGRALGRRLAHGVPYVVIGESVPAGTTTALAVLLGLGYPALGKVSSSMSENNHALKERIVRQGLQAARLPLIALEGGALSNGRVSAGLHPLDILACVGDPMQPAVAGLALGALEWCPVLLAGGTQMVAVLAAMRAILAEEGDDLPVDRLAVATTRWVVEDPTSDFSGLLGMVAPVPALSTMLSFEASRHASLRLYEKFLVKEGVGAGGAAVAACLAAGLGQGELLAGCEAVFERLVGA